MLSAEVHQHDEMQGKWLKNVLHDRRWSTFNNRVVLGCIFTLSIGALPLSTLAAPIPDLICHEETVRFVDPRTLKVRDFESSTTYRFTKQKLYIKSSDRGEYLYGPVSEIEPGRYTVGHKTIYFSTRESNRIVFQLTHVYNDEVRISLAKCTKQ
jgi:hypothetical protein